MALYYNNAATGKMYQGPNLLGSIYDGSTNVNPGNTSYISASGGTITTFGDYKIHTFTATGSSTFTVFNRGDISNVLIIGGGGAGGAGPFSGQYGSGGGGGGGVIYTDAFLLSTGSYTVYVGAGGTPNLIPVANQPGGNGITSSFYGLVALGGGGGAYEGVALNGVDGGSGGGGAGTGVGGAGLQPSQSGEAGLYGYGNSGSAGGAGVGWAGGGGGAGMAATSSNGGNGIELNITGSSSYYSGGGAGGENGLGIAVPGGLGGGGYIDINGIPYPGTNGTGGGGAGTNSQYNDSGEYGGSGVVIIKYKYQN